MIELKYKIIIQFMYNVARKPTCILHAKCKFKVMCLARISEEIKKGNNLYTTTV